MIRMEVQGLHELEHQLKTLGEDMAAKILTQAGKTAMAVVQEDMKEHAGYNPESDGPHMRDSIKVRSRNQMKNTRWKTVVTIRVGPSREHTQKALAQEFGTSKQVAAPFMRSALDYNKAKILGILAVQIREGIEDKR